MDSFTLRDMRRSHAAFKRVVWPVIERACGGGLIFPVEGAMEDAMARYLDTLAGIDFFHIKPQEYVRGLATRVQDDTKYRTKFRTFTVRYKRDSGAPTEFEKRKNSIESEHGAIYPHLTCQAYVDGWSGPLVAVGLAKTADVMRMAEESHHNRTSNASFAIVSWKDMRRRGMWIFMWERGTANDTWERELAPQEELFTSRRRPND